MRIALLSDIHANLEALLAVLEDLKSQKTDAVWSLGDVIGYGPHPCECLREIRRLAAVMLKGNHEAYVGRLDVAESLFNPIAYMAIAWTAGQLSAEELVFVSSLPELCTKRLRAWTSICAVHGSFTGSHTDTYILSFADAELQLPHMPARIGFVGHTHKPMYVGRGIGSFGVPEENAPVALPAPKRFLINPGSVGKPRDGDPRASYGVLDVTPRKTPTFTLRRVPYDIEKTVKSMQDAGLPDILWQRLRAGK